MKNWKVPVSLLILCLALGLAVTAGAAEKPEEQAAAAAPAEKTEPEAETETYVTFAGLQVAIDENGQVRQPTAEEAAEMAKAMRQKYGFQFKSGERLPFKNGSNAVAIGPEYWKSTVVTIEEDGKVTTRCVTGADAARHAADHDHSDDEQ